MKNNSTITTQCEKTMSQVSMTKGFWFYFKHDGHDISVHGSVWSGKEAIYVNNHPVSIKRVLFSFSSDHYFEIDGQKYRVTIKTHKISTGEVHALLYKGEELLGIEKLAYASDDKNKSFHWPTFIATVVAAIGIGYVIGYLIGRFAKVFFA